MTITTPPSYPHHQHHTLQENKPSLKFNSILGVDFGFNFQVWPSDTLELFYSILVTVVQVDFFISILVAIVNIVTIVVIDIQHFHFILVTVVHVKLPFHQFI